MKDLLNQLEESCILHNLILPNTRVLISCSGGQDSITLLFLLFQLQPHWNWVLGVTYCNHMWRHQAIQTGSKLAKISLSLGLQYYLSVGGTQIEHEEEGRSWRLRTLSRISCLHGWVSICTAHTASDRVETVLANIVRGTSSWGLRSISWCTHTEYSPQLSLIPIVRPALGISRINLRNYATRWKLPLCYDISNQDQRIRRNRIRHELLPYLRQWWNPQIDKVLAQNAELTSWETIYYDLFCTQICQQYEWIAKGAVRFPCHIFQSMPTSLHTRILWIFLTRGSFFLNPVYAFQADYQFVYMLLVEKTFRFRHGPIYIIKTPRWIKLILFQ